MRNFYGETHLDVDEALAARAAAFATAGKRTRKRQEGNKTSDEEHDDRSTEQEGVTNLGRSGFSRVF